MMRGAGRIAPGGPADVVVVDWERIAHPHVPSDAAVIDVLLARGKGLDVKTVIVGGDVLLRDGVVVAFDEDAAVRTLVEGARLPAGRLAPGMEGRAGRGEAVLRGVLRRLALAAYEPHYTVNSRT